MSGIIGSAGSKSGIIGQPELDYEEGTFTPKLNGVAANSTAVGKYIKIGNTVNVSVNYDHTALTNTNLPSSTHAYISDLPFISTSLANYNCKFWFDWYFASGDALYTVSGHMGASQDRFYLYQIDTNRTDQTASLARVLGSTVGTSSGGVRFLIRGGSTYQID